MTSPAAVRKTAGILPGDVLLACATGPGKVELLRLRWVPLRSLWERYAGPGTVDNGALREAIAKAAVEHVICGAERP